MNTDTPRTGLLSVSAPFGTPTLVLPAKVNNPSVITNTLVDALDFAHHDSVRLTVTPMAQIVAPSVGRQSPNFTKFRHHFSPPSIREIDRNKH